jgi:uroporphyrinogen-III synthase
MLAKPLLGKTIAVPETRELERLTRLLAAEGAIPLSCPLVGIRDADDPSPIEAWLRLLAERAFDDVILLTGEGVRRLAGFAERAGMLEPVVQALAQVRTITRGPKPAAALHELGIRPTRPARVPTADGIMSDLSGEVLAARRVGLQLYGDTGGQALVPFLEGKGASVHAVAPYVYLDACDDARVHELIDKVIGRAVDAIAFTSSAQVDRIFEVAGAKGADDALLGALCRTVVAAVGPTCADSLRRRGIEQPIVPERSFFMRSLIEELSRAFGGS